MIHAANKVLPNFSELQVTRILVKSKVKFKVKLEILRQSEVEVKKSQSAVMSKVKLQSHIKSQKKVKFIFRFNSIFFRTTNRFKIKYIINYQLFYQQQFKL